MYIDRHMSRVQVFHVCIFISAKNIPIEMAQYSETSTITVLGPQTDRQKPVKPTPQF